jgi:hypothetical protein
MVPMMMNARHANTAKEIELDGNWMKVAKKHYLHGSGIEVRYNCNRWKWEVVGHGEAYDSLWAAKYRAERLSADV